MLVKTYGSAVYGVNALTITIEVSTKPYNKNYEKNIINKEIIVRAATIK